MRGARGYREYFETYTPENAIADDVDVDALRERFVKKVYDDRFTDALPYVYRAHKKQKESVSDAGAELEEWADGVTESTWARPDNSDKVTALQELLKSPVMCGIDGIDAKSKIEPIIGDDGLNDTIERMAQDQGPDADATVAIKTWLSQNMPELLGQIQIGDNNGRDAQTNFAQPVSPQAAVGDEYGAPPTATQNNSNITYENSDPLNFIRSLAGLVK